MAGQYGATPQMAGQYGATPQMAGQYGATPAMTPGMGGPPGMYAPTPQMGGQTPFAPTPVGMAGDTPQVPAPGPPAPAPEAEAPGGDGPIVAADLANPQVLKDLVVTLPDGRCGVVASIDVGSGSLACMLLMGTVVKDKDKGKDVKFVHDKSSNGGFVQEMHPGRNVSLASNPGRNTLVRIVADRGCVNEVARAHDGEDGTLIGFTEDDDEVIVRMVEDSMDIKVLAARYIALRVDSNAA